MKWIYQWFILAVWKDQEGKKDGKKVNVLCIFDRNHERSVVVLDHFTDFKGIYLIVEYNIENEDGILIEGKGIYYLKTKISTQNQSSASLKLRKYLPKHGKWPSQHLCLKINSEFHAGKIPANNIWESSHVQSCFIQQKAYLCLRPYSLDNTLNRASSAWESFNIRQKLGLFVLGVTHILNLPTYSLRQISASEWVGLY